MKKFIPVVALSALTAVAAQAATSPKQLGNKLLIATYKNPPDGFHGTGKVTLGDDPDRKGGHRCRCRVLGTGLR